MQFSIQNKLDYWVAFNAYLLKTLPKQHKTFLDNKLVMIILWAALAIAVRFAFDLDHQFNANTALAVGLYLLIAGAVMYIEAALKREAFYPNPKGVFIGEHHFTIDETGIHTRGAHYSAHHAWPCVQKIERVNAKGYPLILLFLDNNYAFILPEEQLETPDSVYQTICQLHQQSQ